MTDGLVGNRYRLHERIGEGGMAVVWRATDELLGRQVAIKRIRLDLLDGDTAEVTRQRTLREARIAAQLHHPHVVSIFDVLQIDGDPWLVLEYVPSESLAEALAARGPMTPRDAAGTGVGVADALAAAHAAGVAHRDVKPGNVLLGRAGTVKLTDFGISHATGDVTLTRADLLTGTPAFLAPEVARGGPGDAPSDVYSLGATLYAAVEGAPPYGDGHDNVFRLLQLVASGQVPAPRRAGPLGPVLQRMMQTDPARRPSAAEARELLRGVTAPPPPPPRTWAPPHAPWPVPHPPPAAPRRRRTALVAAAVAAVLLVGVGTVVAVAATRGATPTAAAVPGPTGPDPCSLADPAALRMYGPTELDLDVGEFASCQMSLTPPGGGRINVTTQLVPARPAGEVLPGTVETRDDVAIGRVTELNGYCDRTIVTADDTRVVVSAAARDGASGDLCAIAETAAQTAITRITGPGITERVLPDDPDSLVRLDACSLLDAAALAADPGFAGVEPVPGYGGWTCTWSTATLPFAALSLSRHAGFGDADGRSETLAGREVRVLPGSYADSSSCLVQVVHRDFTAANGEPRTEKLQLLYGGAGTVDEQCAVARRLVEAAIPLLPAP